MGGMWSELGKKLAERWVSLLALPGALYLAITAAAIHLGQARALDIAVLVRKIGETAKNPTVSTTGGQAIVLCAILVGATMAGLLVQALATVIERIVLAAEWETWPRPLSTLAADRVRRRRTLWDAAHEHYHRTDQQAMAPHARDRPTLTTLARAARDRSRIAAERPQRPTWSGDRIHAAALRLHRDYNLDLATVWPYTWLVLPDRAREEVVQTRSSLTRATGLAGWSLLYLTLTPRWWPAAVITITLAVAARHRIRVSVNTYAEVMEATTRLYATTLATELGITHTGSLTKELGTALTQSLRSSPPHEPTRSQS
ncbi:hypothetical protein [Nocardia sp. XZ_19_385]|uniref:hypothetical protein n=1 Tax=Nocardia sp. XZ_19_385 TaxID=2769488 RepID=UPI001E50DFC5|nr:hypothetical protein [Nocardia sp. XZ_19_385]